MPGNCLFEKKWRHGWRAKKINDKNFVLSAHGRALCQMFVKTGNCLFEKKMAPRMAHKDTNRQERSCCQLTDVHFCQMFVKNGNCLFEKKWRHGWRIKTTNDKSEAVVSSRTCILPDVCKNRKLSFCKKNGATDGA